MTKPTNEAKSLTRKIQTLVKGVRDLRTSIATVDPAAIDPSVLKELKQELSVASGAVSSLRHDANVGATTTLVGTEVHIEPTPPETPEPEAPTPEPRKPKRPSRQKMKKVKKAKRKK